MRLLPSDPDVATIVARIQKADINLQPEFQRGEVWSTSKKQKLIDSILRDWHVPPVHVIEVKGSAQQEVLDGQQRLVSIRDFVNDEFPIDGKTEPYSADVAALDGLRYSELPIEARRKFDRFTIRVFLITDYDASEPGELFYRLNQPASLTAAEQRNAFFGPARQQVKDLVLLMESRGISKSFLGFSNARMAYDDVLARLCCSMEEGTLFEKITAAKLASRYRSETPFEESIIQQMESALSLMANSRPFVQKEVRFNKATLFSWLWFVKEIQKIDVPAITPKLVGSYIGYFETSKEHFLSAERENDSPVTVGYKSTLPPQLMGQLIYVYNDRSTARVADVASVVYRDIVTWILFAAFLVSTAKPLQSKDERLNVLLSLLDDTERLRYMSVDALIEDIATIFQNRVYR